MNSDCSSAHTEPGEAGRESRRADEEWARTFDAVPDLIAILDSEHRVIRCNKAMREVVALAPEDLGKVKCFKLLHGTDRAPEHCPFAPVPADGQTLTQEVFSETLGRHFLVTISPLRDGQGRVTGCVHVARDITERKRAEEFQETGREILLALNEPGTLRNSIERVLSILKTRTGFDAVGIRMKDGDDFPYYSQAGFSEDFLLLENTLVERAADGGVCRDANGAVSLECTCGLIISGKTDPTHPLFTPGGSCWTNDALPLLDVPPGEDPRHRPRNTCIHQGYASVALVPIRDANGIVGLIQLNDRRQGRLTLGMVEHLEGIASHIGVALMRRRTEDRLTATLVGLRHSESFLNTLIDAIPVPVFCKNKAGAYNRFNKAFTNFIGKREADLMGKTVFDLQTDPALAEKYHAMDKELLQAGGVQVYPSQVKTLDGSLRDVIFFKAAYPDETGQPGGIVGTILDITEQKRLEQGLKDSRDLLERRVRERTVDLEVVNRGLESEIAERDRAEKALKESEERYRLIYEGSVDAIVWLDVNTGRLMNANPAAEKLWECSKGELHGVPFSTLHPPEVLEEIGRIFRKGVEPSGLCVESLIVTRTGRRIPVEITTSLAHIGGASFIQGLFRDITERKRAVEQAREHQEQLVQAAKMVALGTLVSGVGHEINNPNQFIMLNAPILENLVNKALPLLDRECERSGDFRVGQMRYSELREMIPSLVAGLKKGSLRIKQIVEELRNFSVPVATEVAEEIQLARVVESALALMEHMIRKATTRFTFRKGENIPPVRGSFQRLEQVAINLLQNACQALPDKDRKIEVDVFHDEVERRVVLSVRDEGRGMDEETLRRIREPFFTTRRDIGGTGLGVPISDRIVSEHGGMLLFKSEPGKGTVARVELPDGER